MFIARVLLFLGALCAAKAAHAEADRMRLSHGYSSSYLPLMIVRDQHLLEKHAAAMGLGKVETTWQALDGGNVINDAILAGSIDAAGIGMPGFITLWSKARAVPKSQVIGISAISGGAMWLNTNKPDIRSLRDFTDKDKIALPGIKTSFAAIALQMAVAKEFGIENYARLDPFTVGMPHPDAAIALMGGRSEITAHMASPPFSNQEVANPKIHRVLNTRDVFGPLTILMTMASKPFADANPKLMLALIEATDEAVAFIAAHKREAAESYIRVMNAKTPLDDLLAVLNDPEAGYGTTPTGAMQYAQFLLHTGTIKVAPAAWTDLFVAPMHGRSGN
ncbi:MAG: ABC transporter substrate-binding protein [Rhodospirillales bacterium]